MENKNLLHSHLVVGFSFILVISLVIFLSALTVNAVKEGRYIGRPDTERDTITITGEGKVTAIPDIGQITVSIRTENLDATKAQEENITQFNSLVDALKESGVKKEDLKTSNYSLNPRYDWNEGERTLKGYEVNQSLEVKIRDLGKSGDVIKLASQNGVNDVSGLSFTIDDPEDYRALARAEALENAKKKADSLAELMDVSLGKIVSFSESTSGGISPRYYEADVYAFAEEASLKSAPAPEFEAGSEEVRINATIVYEIY